MDKSELRQDVIIKNPKIHETAFTAKGSQIIGDVTLKKDSSVISLGGGAFLNEKIRNKVLLTTKSFWLTTSLEILKARLKNNNKRPLLKKVNINEIENILKERNKTYSLANYEIKCKKLTLNQISNKIIRLYENSKIQS